MRAGALPSPIDQARVFHDVLTVAKRENYRVNLIEAFDQPWKRRLEGTVGGHWGLLDAAHPRAEVRLGRPVSNHPHWRWQAAAGLAVAALVFAAGLAMRPRDDRPPPAVWPRWLGVAAMRLCAGTLIGWAIENVPIGKPDRRATGCAPCVLVALAIAGPVLGAARRAVRTRAAAVRRHPRRAERAEDRLGLGARADADRALRGRGPGRARARVRSALQGFSLHAAHGRRGAVSRAELVRAARRRRAARRKPLRGGARRLRRSTSCSTRASPTGRPCGSAPCFIGLARHTVSRAGRARLRSSSASASAERPAL